MKIVEHYTDYPTDSIITIVDAKYIGDFAIRITFDDGHQKLVDFKPFLEYSKHPAIKKYLDEDQFKRFTIIDGNLNWNDFELSFPIKDLYANSILKVRSTYNIV